MPAYITVTNEKNDTEVVISAASARRPGIVELSDEQLADILGGLEKSTGIALGKIKVSKEDRELQAAQQEAADRGTGLQDTDLQRTTGVTIDDQAREQVRKLREQPALPTPTEARESGDGRQQPETTRTTKVVEGAQSADTNTPEARKEQSKKPVPRTQAKAKTSKPAGKA